MAGTQSIKGPRCDRLIEEAVSARSRVVLTHQTPQGWQTYKAGFVSGSKEARTLEMKLHGCAGARSESLAVQGGTWGVTFRTGHMKCMFSAAAAAEHRPTPDGLLLTLTWPQELHRLQRRVFQRVVPPKEAVIAVRFWRETGASPTAAREPVVRHGQLEDLSAGGMRIQAADPLDICLEGAYRCSFSPRPGAPGLVLDATLRHHQAAEHGRASLGFRFIGLETTPEGRRILDRLARIVSSFQQKRRRPVLPQRA